MMKSVLRYHCRLLTAAWLLAGSWVNAQDMITNSTNIFIPEGVEIHVDGNIVNTGFIQNQGNILFTGNWNNTHVYQGMGTVTFYGSRAQVLFNNNNGIHQLVVDGGGDKTLRGTVEVAKRFSLLSGVVFIADADTLLVADGATVEGGSSSSYVDGAFTQLGSGYKFFPIGKNGNYHPVELMNVTGLKPQIEMEVQENLPSVNAPSGITVYSQAYWQLKTVRGTFTGSPVSVGYQIPDGYTNRRVMEILQSTSLAGSFKALGDVTVDFDNDVDRVMTDNLLTENFIAIGESIPPGGIPGEFYISNSLSPRAADPDNRVVKVFGNALAADNFKFLVFNRWGLVVYETASLETMVLKGWDGKHKGDGNYLPSGTYPFVMKASNSIGEVVERKGVITIIN